MSPSPDPEEDAAVAIREEKLKSALWYATGKLVDDVTLKLGTNATPQFIAALTEAIWTQIETLAIDVERFAAHAGRKDVGIEDVLLICRRNEGLEGMIKARVEREKAVGGSK